MTYDLMGKRFERLLVIGNGGSKEHNRVWVCRCDCGTEKPVTSEMLVSGGTRSCGCIRRSPVYGHTWPKRSPTYNSWSNMIARCTYPSNPAFTYYKAKGITICDRWRTFKNFLDDMGKRPSRNHTIDRYPNNLGNYEPGNCRWATKRQQANNRVTNKLFVYQGVEMTFANLVRATGLGKELLRHRLLRAGWTVEEAVNAPKQQGRRPIGARPHL